VTQLCVAPHCVLPGTHATDGEAEHDYTTCRGCAPALAADGLYLCGHCLRTMERDAWKAAQLYAALGQALAGGGRADSGPGGSSTGVDLNDAAVEARGTIRATLVGLCRMIAEERGIGLPEDRVVAMAAYVSTHARWLAAHAAADEHARDLRDVATDGRSWRVAYAVAGDRTLIGLCNRPQTAEDGDPVPCGTRLYVREGADWVTCDGCGAEGTVRWWRWELCAAADALEVVDAYEAASLLSWRWARPVDPGLVRKWGQRYDDAGMLRKLIEVTPLGAVEREWVEGEPLKDRVGRVLFVLAMLERRAERMWGPADDTLAKAAS
jgi:hypothetical protein